MWGLLARWWKDRPDGAAVEAAQREADDALQRSLIQKHQAVWAVWQAAAVRRERDRITRELERMRPRGTG